jgi:hypothetical protein
MKKEWKQRTWFRAPDGTKGSNQLVAQLAGVTSGTVYNVFNHPERVIPETTQKVLAAVEKLNYTANAMPTTRMCTVCKVAKPFKDFYDTHKAKKQEGVKNKRYLHSRCKDCDSVRGSIYRENNKEKLKKLQLISHRFRTYGLTQEQYDDMVLNQKNLCAICNKASHKTLHIDHDHATGRVRGLLCANCNTGIGFFKENLVTLNRAIQYLS